MLAGSHRNAWPDETGTGGRTNRNTHKEMQVNTKYLDGKPEAQQLVLVNRDDIKQWLFNS